MNASPKTEWLVLPAAGVSLAGWAAHEPLISLGAAALAAVVVSGRSHRVAWAGFGPIGSRSRPRLARIGEIASALSIQAFSGGDWLSPPPASETDEDASDESDKSSKDQGSRAYEEFAAGLEDDATEEISFLPPYASNSGRSAGGAQSTAGIDPSSDSLLAGDLTDAEDSDRKMPVPRRFALATVAIIRRLLEPTDVERILVEQRRYPRLRFGDVAVQLGLLTEDEVQELLIAQEQGLFSEQEIAEARERLSTYHNG